VLASADVDEHVAAPLLSDADLAQILGMTVPWVRAHATGLPGFRRLGVYFRFHRPLTTQWLGSLEPLLDAADVARLLSVPKSWVYANADQIPGAVRLGHYVRFRPVMFKRFLAGSGLAQ
jgi:hypothetical protein